MHDLFDLSNEGGLSDLLREEALSDETVNGLVQKTEIPGLDVLTSGPATHAAANLLYSPNLAELIAKFKKQYDMVLIDTPPMLQMTDARAEGTTRDAIVAATQRFTEDRIRVLGTILNAWDPKRSGNSDYGYYKGSYYGTYKERPTTAKA
jgi:succinoglycan biosynthesis transport protein ExoP